MSNILTRIRKYTTKYTPANLTRDLTVKLPKMSQHFAAVQPNLVEMETSVKQIVDNLGAPTIHYPFYLNFGRELWKLQRDGFSGASLQQAAAVGIAKWVARGMQQPILEAIRDGMNIAAPSGS